MRILAKRFKNVMLFARFLVYTTRGETMDEVVPRAGRNEVNSAAADAVARVGDLEGAAADAGSGGSSDNPAANAEVGVADEGGRQVTASPVLPLAEQTGASAPPVVAPGLANGGGRERGGGGGRGWWKKLVFMAWPMFVVIDFCGVLMMVDR